jgi:hypothetical protein
MVIPSRTWTPPMMTCSKTSPTEGSRWMFSSPERISLQHRNIGAASRPLLCRMSMADRLLGSWCGRGDSNPYGIATASPSSWCVCQFRHFRVG